MLPHIGPEIVISFHWLLSALLSLLFIVGLNLLFIAVAATILGTISRDYFLEDAPHRSSWSKVLRNLLGATVVVVGLIMLVLPGPGFVMIVAGLVLIENHRKTRLLERLLARPGVYRAVKKLRARFNKPMFHLSTAAQQQLESNRAKAAARKRVKQ